MLDPDQIPEQDRGITLGSTDVVRRLFEILLQMAVEGLESHDLVRLVFNANELDRPISTNLRRVSDMTVDVLLACIVKVLQSKDTITLDEGFFINIIKIRRPTGSGRNRKVVNADLDRLAKGSVITIRGDAAGLCCSMAILLGKAILEKDSLLPTLKKQSCDVLMRRAMKLHAEAGVHEGPCGYTEIAVFERYLDVQVIVISSRELQKVIFVLFLVK